ncbi:hypothetical protein QQ045_031375 [Rhodiola kirilowii]
MESPLPNPNPKSTESDPHFTLPSPYSAATPLDDVIMLSSSSLPAFSNCHQFAPKACNAVAVTSLLKPAKEIDRDSLLPEENKPASSNSKPPSYDMDLCLTSSSNDGFTMSEIGVSESEQNEVCDDTICVPDGAERYENAGSESRELAVVPRENEVVVAKRSAKKASRSAAMVRVSEMDSETERRFYVEYRALRILYDSLRVSPLLISGERGVNKRNRPDLDAATLMKKKGLWLHRDKRIIGSLPGVSVGDIFFRFIELCVFGLHGQTQAGIDYVCASQSLINEPIATSIVYSGGYEDNEDFGDVLIYSGQGGKDKFNKQCAHQKLEGANLALYNSMRYAIELRVIRGIKIARCASKVYVYDGLYKIVESWYDVGKSGFGVLRFKLVREPGQPCLGSAILKLVKYLKSDPLAVKPTGYVHLDISLGRENVPVSLYNDVDSCCEPLSFEYISKTVFPPPVFQQPNYQPGCSCVSVCGQNCACAIKNDGDFAYDKNGVLLKWKPVIFECGTFCKCPPTCHNRVSQNGLKTHLEVFRSEGGWGVRSLDLIQAGAFICEYSGVILTKEQATLFALDVDELMYPNRFVYRQRIWGDLSMVYSNFVLPTYPSIPPIEYALDVSRYRGVASYIRHSSCPNLMVQLVHYSHRNLYFPHLMIFSMENIPPMKELTLDYGIQEEPSGDIPEILHI